MHRLMKFWQLPGQTKLLLFESLARLAAVSAAVHLMPGTAGRRHWTGALQTPSQHAHKAQARDRETITWCVAAASRFVPGATCLVQAMVAQRLLLRAGYPAELKIGVTKGEHGSFAAHAWLVSEGEIVIGRDEMRRYSEMPAIIRCADRCSDPE